MNIAIYIILFFFGYPSLAHESCCKHKLLLKQPQVDEFIVDPTDVAPSEFQGQSRYITDPNDEKPEHWDDEFDGEWEPNVIPNPNYTWKPRLMPNPNYVPPPTYYDKFQTELFAAVPWVVMGIFVTAIMNCVITIQPHHFKNIHPLFASLLGLATPLCSCGVLPVAANLVSSSVPLGTVMVFLTASQSAGLDSAMLTWGILGSLAVWIRLGGAILLALAVGYAVGNTNKLNQSNPSKCCPITENSYDFKKFWTSLTDTALEICPTVLMGLALSTAVLHFVPLQLDQVSSSSSSSALVRLGLLLSAIPLQLCEHTSVTLASAIAQGGGSAGLALAFLVSGPAINMPTLLFLLRRSSLACLVRVVVILTSTALVLSYALDYNTSPDLLLDLLGEKMPDLPAWYMKASPWIAGALCVMGLMRQCLFRVQKKGQDESCCKTKVA